LAPILVIGTNSIETEFGEATTLVAWETGVCRATQAEHAAESVAAAEFGSNDIALRAERFAQREDLYLKVFFRHHDARPHAAEELFFCDEQAIGLQ
jgi:hypothetical protein